MGFNHFWLFYSYCWSKERIWSFAQRMEGRLCSTRRVMAIWKPFRFSLVLEQTRIGKEQRRVHAGALELLLCMQLPCVGMWRWSNACWRPVLPTASYRSKAIYPSGTPPPNLTPDSDPFCYVGTINLICTLPCNWMHSWQRGRWWCTGQKYCVLHILSFEIRVMQSGSEGNRTSIKNILLL